MLVDKLKLRTALTDVSPIEGTHTLNEVALCGKINLRGDITTPAFKQGVKTALNLSLPDKANTLATADEKSIFWLGPDEWLIHVPLKATADTVDSLRSELGKLHVAITDVSDYFSVISLSGVQAREIIASACPFDTRKANFPIGHCAQTRFGHASILLWPSDDIPSFELQVRWSYAQYVYNYLCESIRNAENLNEFRSLP